VIFTPVAFARVYSYRIQYIFVLPSRSVEPGLVVAVDEAKVGVRGTLGSNEAELLTLSMTVPNSMTGTFRAEVKLGAAASELGVAANEDNSALNAAPWSSGS
ncbi:hypothetical protein L916_08534, partial [Phytophthora nicotianae]